MDDIDQDHGITVGELIEQLRALPQDAEVQYYTYDDYQDEPVMWMPVTGARMGTGESKFGDAGPAGMVCIS